MGRTLRTLLKRSVHIINTDHASTKMRSLKGIYVFSASAHVPTRGVDCTLGRELPRSVIIRSSYGISSAFRPHFSEDQGACRCQVLGQQFHVPAEQLSACFCRCPLSIRGVRRTTSCLINRRSFGDFYTIGTRSGADMQAVCTYAIAGRTSVVAVQIAKGKFLCGVIQVVTKALVGIKTKRFTPRRVRAVLSTYSQDITKPATPTRKLAVVKLRCRWAAR